MCLGFHRSGYWLSDNFCGTVPLSVDDGFDPSCFSAGKAPCFRWSPYTPQTDALALFIERLCRCLGFDCVSLGPTEFKELFRRNFGVLLHPRDLGILVSRALAVLLRVCCR